MHPYSLQRAFENIMYLWNKKPLVVYGEKIAEYVLTVLCHLLKCETIIKVSFFFFIFKEFILFLSLFLVLFLLFVCIFRYVTIQICFLYPLLLFRICENINLVIITIIVINRFTLNA